MSVSSDMWSQRPATLTDMIDTHFEDVNRRFTLLCRAYVMMGATDIRNGEWNNT